MSEPKTQAFVSSLRENRRILDAYLNRSVNFDIRAHEITLQERASVLYYIDGFVMEEQYAKIIENFQKNTDYNVVTMPKGYAECRICQSVQEAGDALLYGSAIYLIDGCDRALLLDTRFLPGREIGEPESDRVLRGARDGFVEVMVTNTALIRRRLHTPTLTFEKMQVGAKSRTDVVLCYLSDRVDAPLLQKMRKKLASIRIDALNFGQETLAEALMPHRFYNPFPKVRFTERPDEASALLLDGKLLILCDNTPAVMVLPVSVFDFMQESDDYYFPPVTATYLRCLRLGIFFLTVFLTPVWYWLQRFTLPPFLSFLDIQEQYAVPILVQLFLTEFAIDGLKLASLNTPSMLNNSLSIIGGLILGDLAVSIGFLAPQVIFYMAFVAIGNFSQPNFELGYAFKFMRLIMLALVALFDTWGLVGGFLLTGILLSCNQTVDGARHYLYPLIPFDAKRFLRVFVRRKVPSAMEGEKGEKSA